MKNSRHRVLPGLLLLWLTIGQGHAQLAAQPTQTSPLVIDPQARVVRVFGVIYPARFNAARDAEAQYHLLVWQGGQAANALMTTPADDLTFHDALVELGARPGNNLTMAAWTERHDPHSTAPLKTVTGDSLAVRIAWAGNPVGIPVAQAFRQHPTPDPQPSTLNPQHPTLNTRHPTPDPRPPLLWRFGGNRGRWFNRVPLAPRPGCLACLYSCPSGKVSNGALRIHDYVTSPARFVADTDRLPPDGTPVVVTFHLPSS